MVPTNDQRKKVVDMMVPNPWVSVSEERYIKCIKDLRPEHP